MLLRVGLFLAFIVLFATPGTAQSGAGQALEGTVRDLSKAPSAI